MAEQPVPIAASTVAIDIDADRVARWLFAAAIAFVAVSWIGKVLGDPFDVKLLDVDTEQSIPTLFSVLLIIAAATLAVVVGLVDRAERLMWWFVGLCLLGVAIDEGTAIHEKFVDPIRDRLDTGSIFHFAWVIPYSILLVVFVAITVPFLRRLAPHRRNGLLLAGAVFVAGALGLEMVGAAWADENELDNLTFQSLASVEELLEMIGMILMVRFLLRDLSEQRAELGLRFRSG